MERSIEHEAWPALGGAVRGGVMHGTFPELRPSGPDCLSPRCPLLPSSPWEAIWKPLAQWLGVDDARAEARYLLEHPPPPGDEGELKELKEALRRAQAATASYLALAPGDQVRAAREATQGAVR